MSLKKRKKLLFVFVVLIIIVLMFSVVGIVVLYLGGNQGIAPVVPEYIPPSEDVIIFEDPALQPDPEPVEEEVLFQEDVQIEASGDVVADTGAILDLPPSSGTGE